MSTYTPKYKAVQWVDLDGNYYTKNPRYAKLFKLAMSRGGFDFAVWYMAEIFERTKTAFYDVDEALSDWNAEGRPIIDHGG